MRAMAIALLMLLTDSGAATAVAACLPGAGIGLARIVEIDTRTGPLFGFHTG